MEKLQRALESGDTGGIGQDRRLSMRGSGPVVRSPVKNAPKVQPTGAPSAAAQANTPEEEEVMLLV